MRLMRGGVCFCVCICLCVIGGAGSVFATPYQVEHRVTEIRGCFPASGSDIEGAGFGSLGGRWSLAASPESLISAATLVAHDIRNKLPNVAIVIGQITHEVVVQTDVREAPLNLYRNTLGMLVEQGMSRLALEMGRFALKLQWALRERREIYALLSAASMALINDYTQYDPALVEQLTLNMRNKRQNQTQAVAQQKQPLPICWTMTSCKRLDLFRRTMNSWIRSCRDCHLIDRWIVIDDNSSPEDRQAMQAEYPFLEFHMKSPSQKGHPVSMNILRDQYWMGCSYVWHMEDDWAFFVERNYISECLQVLRENPTVAQCIANRNYAETPNEANNMGGHLVQSHVDKSLHYWLHEYYAYDSSEYKRRYREIELQFNNPNFLWSGYWPHFSLRPGLQDASVYRRHPQLRFNELQGYAMFEFQFAKSYSDLGYHTAFLDLISSAHIGRLVNTNGVNAYELNA